MKVQRMLPPAAAPLKISDIVQGLRGLLEPEKIQKTLKQELREYFNVKHVFLVSSGKAALTMILLALKSLSPARRQVLIPAYTCFSVPSAIVKSGLDVALCDIDPDHFDYNYELLPDAVGMNTLCVIAGNLFGVPSDTSRIVEICKRKGIYVVEDAAQAMGGTHQKRLIGTIGDVGFFSLGRGKNITCGSGGIIVTNSDAIAAALDRLYAQLAEPGFLENGGEFLKAIILALFIRPSLYWLPAGLPFLKLGETFFYRDFPVQRLSGMKAGMLKHWRRRLEEYNRARKANAEYYCKTLQQGINQQPESSQELIAADALLRLPVLANSREIRDDIISSLSKQGFGVSRMYPAPIHMIEEIKSSFSGQEYPAAQMLSDRLFTVPVHPLVSERERSALCEELRGLNNASMKACEKSRWPVTENAKTP